MPSLTLTKHHGLGNDFLVLLDLKGEHAGLDTRKAATRLCDRRRGVGADGLIIGWPGTDGADVDMELRNADGGEAEMSGNGIRCLAQAMFEAGAIATDEVTILTTAGRRIVRCVNRPRPGYMHLAVDMGEVRVLSDDPRWRTGSIKATAIVNAGNPHLVLLDPDLDDVDLAVEGPRLEAAFSDGINVEWIWPGPGPDELTLRVWERGAGATQACGTGSCAAAAAAMAWGRVGRHVVVHNPGGDVTVDLGDTAILTGPAAKVATVEVPWP